MSCLTFRSARIIGVWEHTWLKCVCGRGVMSVCVIHVCECVCAHMYVYLRVKARGQCQVPSWPVVHLRLFIPFYLSSVCVHAHRHSWACTRARIKPSFHPHPTSTLCAPAFSWMLETQTQVPVSAWQAHYKIKPSPQPLYPSLQWGKDYKLSCSLTVGRRLPPWVTRKCCSTPLLPAR